MRISINSTRLLARQAQVCRALADPKRPRIIHALCDTEMTVGDLARMIGVCQANLSQRLMLLRERGLVVTRSQGLHVYYSLSSPKLMQACKIMREVLAEQLARSAQLSHDLKAATQS